MDGNFDTVVKNSQFLLHTADSIVCRGRYATGRQVNQSTMNRKKSMLPL
jgi:hypothetical protein